MIKGFHIANGLIVSSDGETGTNIQFLLDKADDINCLYHLNYNVACLLKMMGVTKEQGQRILTGHYTIKGYQLRYLPGKYFAITYSGRTVQFCDAYSYHADELWRQSPDDNHFTLARRAKEIGQEVYSALCSIGLDPKTLVSPIRAYYNDVLKKMDLPTVDDMPEEAGQFAYNCVKGNLLEAYKLGHFDKVYDYDIISAYPYEISKLLDIRKGKFKKAKKYEAYAVYGFCNVMVCMDADLSPIIYSKGVRLERQNYTPNGAREDYLTKGQIDYIRASGKGEVDIIDGWWWTADYRAYPYENIINELYEYKERSIGLARTTSKRISNGIYGMSLQIVNGKMGELFNPVYGAVIETNTEIKDIEFCDSHNISPIHIAVDGVLTDKKITSGLSDELGGWKLTNEGACFVMGAGSVALKGNKGKGDFSLDYGWIADQIEKYPDKTEYKLSKPAGVTLPIALRGNWDKLGTLQEISRSVDVTTEDKRLFLDMPTCGADLYKKVYESEPLDIVQIIYEKRS